MKKVASIMSMDASGIFEKTLHQFEEQQKLLDAKLTTALNKLDLCFNSLDDCVKAHKSQMKEYKALHNMLSEVSKSEEIEVLEGFRARLEQCEELLRRLKSSTPKTGSFFIRLMIGKVNVRLWKGADKALMRDEYNKFKKKTTVIFLAFPLLQWLVPAAATPLIWTLHQLWLLYYYFTLALRENILAINGSSVKAWWIYHHYISIIVATVGILWDYNQVPRREFLIFMITQGVVMMVQNLYQSRRVYVRKTLGKSSQLDTDTSETLVEKPTDLKLLVPMLFFVYFMELYIAGSLLGTLLLASAEAHDWNALIVGACFAVLGVGNMITTTQVLFEKQKRIRKVQQKVSTKRADHGDVSDGAACSNPNND